MFLKHLSKFTFMLEGLIPQANCIHVCLYHASRANVTTDDSDSVGCKDQLSLSLHSLPMDQLISTLEAKKGLIKGSHIVTMLDNVCKQSDRIEERRGWIREFIPILDQNKNKLSGQQAIDIIKMLDQLGVEKTSNIYSAMLNHIICCIDDLSLKNFCELSDTIHDETIDHSLRHDLHAVLKGKFLVRLSMDFDENDFQFFQYAFHFISQISPSLKQHDLTQILMRKLCNHADIIPLDTAMSIFTSVHSLDHSQLKDDTLQKVQSDIAEQAHVLTRSQIKEIIQRMPENIKAVNEYYNEKLANALARRLIDGNFDSGIARIALRKLILWRHKSSKLLEYCCATFLKESAKMDPQRRWKKVISLVGLLFAMNERTIFWDEVQDLLSKYAIDHCRNYEDQIHLAGRLVSLDWLSNPLIEKVFDGSFKPVKVNPASNIFCMLYQRLKLDPSYNGPLPTDSQIKDLNILFRKNHYVRKGGTARFLILPKETFKDPACIQTDIKTRFFHHLDYVVAAYEDGTPAPISVNPSASEDLEGLIFIEDLTVPPGAKLIIVIFLSSNSYFRNTKDLVGYQKLNMDSIKVLPYPVVLVNKITWKELREDEKTSFLMNAIRAKLGSAH